MTDDAHTTSASPGSPTATGGACPESIDLAREVAIAIVDKKGFDIAILDVADLLQITEVFVLATGTSRPHVRTLGEAVRERLKDQLELRPLRTEGEEEGEWALLDFGSVVVHLFQPQVRGFYDLERLWADAPRIEAVPSVGNAD